MLYGLTKMIFGMIIGFYKRCYVIYVTLQVTDFYIETAIFSLTSSPIISVGVL